MPYIPISHYSITYYFYCISYYYLIISNMFFLLPKNVFFSPTVFDVSQICVWWISNIDCCFTYMCLSYFQEAFLLFPPSLHCISTEIVTFQICICCNSNIYFIYFKHMICCVCNEYLREIQYIFSKFPECICATRQGVWKELQGGRGRLSPEPPKKSHSHNWVVISKEHLFLTGENPICKW